MQNDLIKELLRIYNMLPSGMLVFKDERLYYVNRHLRNVLTLGDLPVDKSLAIICGILDIEPSEASLLTYLNERRFFTYKGKIIQISGSREGAYAVFVFARIDDMVLEALDVPRAPKPEARIEEEPLPETRELSRRHLEMLKYFEKHKNLKATGYVLYKGIPLIAENVVVQPFKETLVVRVETKQLIAASEGSAWILKIENGVTVGGSVVYRNNDKRYVFLGDLHTAAEGFHQRENIRYAFGDGMSLTFPGGTASVTLKVLDLSEKALRTVTSDAALLEALGQNTRPFRAELSYGGTAVSLACTFAREAGRCEGEAAVVFSFGADEHVMVTLREWLHNRQIELIKEIREAARTLS